MCSDDEETNWNSKLENDKVTPRFIAHYSWYTDTLREDPAIFHKKGRYDLLFLRHKNANGEPVPNHVLTEQIKKMVDAIRTSPLAGE